MIISSRRKNRNSGIKHINSNVRRCDVFQDGTSTDDVIRANACFRIKACIIILLAADSCMTMGHPGMYETMRSFASSHPSPQLHHIDR